MSQEGTIRLINTTQIVDDDSVQSDVSEQSNQGTGAGAKKDKSGGAKKCRSGGAKTTKNGKLFELKTSNEKRLEEQGFTKTIMNPKNKTGYYLSKVFEDKTIIFTSQHGLIAYIKLKYGIELFRHPDEAYIFEYTDGRRILKVLEKKAQETEGSVDTKLLAGPTFREEWELALEGKFIIEYAFCVATYLENHIISQAKKWIIYNQLMKRYNIPILFGDREDYFDTLDTWINSF